MELHDEAFSENVVPGITLPNKHPDYSLSPTPEKTTIPDLNLSHAGLIRRLIKRRLDRAHETSGRTNSAITSRQETANAIVEGRFPDPDLSPVNRGDRKAALRVNRRKDKLERLAYERARIQSVYSSSPTRDDLKVIYGELADKYFEEDGSFKKDKMGKYVAPLSVRQQAGGFVGYDVGTTKHGERLSTGHYSRPRRKAEKKAARQVNGIVSRKEKRIKKRLDKQLHGQDFANRRISNRNSRANRHIHNSHRKLRSHEEKSIRAQERKLSRTVERDVARKYIAQRGKEILQENKERTQNIYEILGVAAIETTVIATSEVKRLARTATTKGKVAAHKILGVKKSHNTQ